MKKVFIITLILSTVLLAAVYSPHIFKYENAQRDTRSEWQEANQWLRIYSLTPGSITSLPFNRYQFSNIDSWNGLVCFTTLIDTFAGSTSTSDTLLMDNSPDTLYFILEKSIGVGWAVVDTLDWYKVDSTDVQVGEFIRTADVRGQALYHMTDPTQASSGERYLEAFPHSNHRVTMYYGDSTFVSVKFFTEFY